MYILWDVFVTWCMEEAIIWWKTGHDVMHVINSNTNTERLWHSNDRRLVFRAQCVKRKRSSHHYISSTRLNSSHMVVYYGFMCQRPVQTRCSSCHSTNKKSSDQDIFFQSSTVQFWWTWGFRFLFLTADGGRTDDQQSVALAAHPPQCLMYFAFRDAHHS